MVGVVVGVAVVVAVVVVVVVAVAVAVAVGVMVGVMVVVAVGVMVGVGVGVVVVVVVMIKTPRRLSCQRGGEYWIVNLKDSLTPTHHARYHWAAKNESSPLRTGQHR